MKSTPPPDAMHIRLNLDAPQGNFLASIQRVLDVVTFLGSGIASINESNFQSFSPFMRFDPAQKHRLDFASAKTETEVWLLRSFLTDVVDHTNAFVEEGLAMCALCKLFESGGPIRGEVWNRFVQKERPSFHKLGLPDKIGRLSDQYSVKSAFSDHVLSLNRARNCLVHRQGIVGKQDIDSSGCLKIVWRTNRLVARDPETEMESSIDQAGVRIEKGTEILVKITNEERVFRLGDRVRLSFPDLYDAVMTLFVFSTTLTKAIDAYAKRTTKSSTSSPR